ncbi:MAG: threonine--tRNA ligase, partial [Thermoguttaceae bacterium]|nr:threonine--tRNA ligase [Thermoguttaceae bacterium]
MKTAYDVLKEAGRVDRSVIAAKVNGMVCDLTTPVEETAEVLPLTFEDEEGKKVFWHTSSHILAAAVKRLYPEAKLTIGPSIETGFYYDFDSPTAFTEEMLRAIEKEMTKIVKENAKEERFTLPRAEAIALMEEKGETWKVKLIERIPEGEEISFYRQGDFVDLCAGPHLFATGLVKAVKLTQTSGAYWEGNAKNAVLHRIYGISFPSKDQLNEHLK